MSVDREIIVTVSLGPRELAQEFCDLDENGQAEFFSTIAAMSTRTTSRAIIGAICRNKRLTPEGRQLMRDIGYHATIEVAE